MASTSDRDRSYWERHSRKYDFSLRALGRPFPRMLELTSEAIAGAERVREVAAGTGLVTPVLTRAAREVVATDYAAAMVTMLESKVREQGLTNVRCEQADFYALRFEAASFDFVVAANVLHVLPDLPVRSQRCGAYSSRGGPRRSDLLPRRDRGVLGTLARVVAHRVPEPPAVHGPVAPRVPRSGRAEPRRFAD